MYNFDSRFPWLWWVHSRQADTHGSAQRSETIGHNTTKAGREYDTELQKTNNESDSAKTFCDNCLHLKTEKEALHCQKTATAECNFMLFRSPTVQLYNNYDSTVGWKNKCFCCVKYWMPSGWWNWYDCCSFHQRWRQGSLLLFHFHFESAPHERIIMRVDNDTCKSPAPTCPPYSLQQCQRDSIL